MKSRPKASVAAASALAAAELVLHVLDAAEPLTAVDEKLSGGIRGQEALLVRNKIDLPAPPPIAARHSAGVDVCCLTGAGIEQLKDAIKEMVWAGGSRPRCCK